FIQLPDYLSRLRNGRPDVPVVLLPVINELRVIQGVEPLSASAVFSTDLAVSMPAEFFNSRADKDADDAQVVAGAQRHRFQAGLLEWYRGDDAGGLQKLLEVLDGLQHASRQEACARLWWLGAAVIEALQADLLQGSTRIKQLFGQIERQIKHLIDAGEQSFAKSVPEDLLKSLLYLLTQTDGNNGRIGEIKQVYDLADDGVSTAHDWIAGCGQELYSTVSAAAGENLEDLKERLDIFMRAGMRQLADLASIAADMHVLGNTLDMIGLDEAAGMLAESEKSLRTISEYDQTLDEAAMQAVANTLVTVGEAIAGICEGEDALTQKLSVDNFVYRQGQEAVIREAVADLVQSAEWIGEYMNAPGDLEKLRQVPQVLDQVRGSLQLAGQERAATMVAKIRGYIHEVLNQDGNPPDSQQLDALADAVCSLEYYV
ncbi:MAG: hypothetical protein R3330_15470, partial [Saprospiraceae bacterium]|nr:hypothetical protein [Saprospiraceae bacterium]